MNLSFYENPRVFCTTGEGVSGFSGCRKTIDSSSTYRRNRACLGPNGGDPHPGRPPRSHDGATRRPRGGHDGATRRPRRNRANFTWHNVLKGVVRQVGSLTPYFNMFLREMMASVPAAFRVGPLPAAFV